MQLIGMLDSPYVRRVAIGATLMGQPFEHRSISVLRQIEQYRAINPLIKAPTLVCDDGEVLMDSSLILAWLDSRVAPAQRLWPTQADTYRRALQLGGIALVACEKTVQHLYETQLRPEAFQYDPWLSRIRSQLADAWALLDAACAGRGTSWLCGDTLCQADIDVAVAWGFNQFAQPGLSDPSLTPALAAFAAQTEALPAFLAYPVDRT
ncbi:glutathione S-transferase family protein [Uliginosibacterium sp. H1]|uniref:glutathione S-transferase family protein n=1 Tax=Uliginosibacterium sp. H1 TaxID=3114757 RepID=UPI002E1953B2|nr:glutathione S-transferase family protein [Uliginosibacterium sp. H1]